ncbi:MAG TPA: hypothetical protein VHR45_03445 [Thermoanaerobaculia bacterium]|nr:hypothetical protein [Thermoanaerobaculia bacterium]
MALIVFLLGGGLIAALVRWWRPAPPWAWVAAYLAASALFFAAPLATPAVQVPTDIAYQWRPWSEVAPLGERPQNDLLSDVPLQFLPFRALVRQRLLAGELPLWAHELGTGQPLADNGISAPWSPLHLLALPLPPLRALTVVAAWQTFLGLLLADALLAALGARRAGATLGAFAFAFSAYAVCWAYHPLGLAAMWVPGVLLGLVTLRRGERASFTGLVACGCGLATSGHPETLAFTALAAAAVTLALLVRPPQIQPGAPPSGRFLLRLGAASALSACLSAPVLLPVVAAIPDSVRAAMLANDPQAAEPPSFTASVLAPTVSPLVYGSPRDGNWRGPANFNELCSGYAGLLPLALALAAAAALRGRCLAIVAAGLAALLAAMRLPPFFELAAAIPGLGQAAHGRLRLFWVLAVAVAAGLGLDELLRRRSARWTAASAVAATAAALALHPPPSEPWQRLWWVATLAGAAAVAAALIVPLLSRARRSGSAVGAAAQTKLVSASGEGASPSPPEGWEGDRGVAGGDPIDASSRPQQPHRRTVFHPSGSPKAVAVQTRHRSRCENWTPWVAVAGLVLDLGLLGGRYLPVLPSRFDLSPPPAVAWLAARTREADTPFRVLAEGFDLMPNLGAYYGLWDARADDPMQPAAAALVVGRGLSPRYQFGRFVLLAPNRLPQPLLDYLGVRYMLERHGRWLPPPWQPVWDGLGGRIWRNPRALPLFFVPARQVAAPSVSAAAALANQDFAASALVEESGPPAAAETPARGRVRIARVQPNGFELELDTPTGCLVASSVSQARGWKLRLDDRPAPLLRVNAAFLGFRVSPGHHLAFLAYRPDAWSWGLRLLALGCAAAAVAGIFSAFMAAATARCRARGCDVRRGWARR